MTRTQSNPPARPRNRLPAALLAVGLPLSCGIAPTRASAPSGLRFAHSPDGLAFRDTGVTFAERASSPDLFRMPGGTLLALFDHAPDPANPNQFALCVALSRDDGKTWSQPRPADISDRAGRRLRAAQGDIILAPDGTIRLFFVEPPPDQPTPVGRIASSESALRCAVTRDGLHYRLDDRFRPPSGLRAPSDPTAARVDDRVFLFARTALTPDPHPDPGKRDLLLSVSRDARQFARLASPDAARDFTPGNFLNVDQNLRHYDSSRDGIRSATSPDGRRWSPDDGVRLANAADPAVIRLVDGSFLMLYRPVPRSSTAGSTPGLASLLRENADTTAKAGDPGANIMTLDTDPQPPESPVPPGMDPNSPSPAPDGADRARAMAQPPDSGEAAPYEVSADESDSADLSDAADTPNADSERDDFDFARSTLPDPDGFAPLPDFANPLNYMNWYHRFAASPLGRAASDAYAELIPLKDSLDGSGTPWPDAGKNLFADPDYTGLPFPWDPADHPEWESSFEAMKHLVDRFRAAAELNGYTTPSVTGDDSNLLLGIMLPALSPHRSLVKATLAEAWRSEGGRVSPERMQGAIRTTLRAAAHLTEGSTLIEELVGLAERRLVRETARAALADNVFTSADQLAETLDILRQSDRPSLDPARTLRGEHAMAMDLIQHLYTPADAQGRPRFNPEHATLLTQLDGRTDDQAAFAERTPADLRAEIDTLDRYYRELSELMTVGYPAARAADLDALQESVVDTGPLTRAILPALSRVHTLRARAEADRRATQLAYATHLFHARNARWPISLAELPADLASEARTDPFTGRDFGYRVDASGPRIYSQSENTRDDGGVHAPRWNDRLENPEDSDDYVFWPPQQN